MTTSLNWIHDDADLMAWQIWGDHSTVIVNASCLKELVVALEAVLASSGAHNIQTLGTRLSTCEARTVLSVGDLTLRQVRHRPQILLRVGEDVGTLYVAPSGEYALLVLNGQPMGRLQPVTLDTPCEVVSHG